MEECYKELNDQLDSNNLEGDRCPFDLSKPLPLVESRGRQIVLAQYFFNNDLKYLRGGSTDRKYTTLITKTKAAKYDLKGIEDMVPTLWSPIKVTYDKHVALVTNVKVNKCYVYGHLEEIEVRRADQQLYKFIEGDFPRHHLNDIDDMLLLVKLNISKPRTCDEDLSQRAPYTTLSDPQGFIYEDKLNRKILMRSDELHKRSWSNLDKKWSHIMVKDIDRQLLERRLMRSIEKFIGGREYRNDYDFVIVGAIHSASSSYVQNIFEYRVIYDGGVILTVKTIKVSVRLSNQNQRDLPRDIPLDRLEVLRYDTKGVKVRKGIMQTKTELTLEQTQQGVSDEVLENIEGVEE
ncbi:hypothetical protein Tco_1277940 [Tanacetum coccineum]